MFSFYAEFKSQYKFKCQTVFSARFDKQNEDDQVLDEVDLYFILSINRNLTSQILIILM